MSKRKSKKPTFKYEIQKRKHDGMFDVWTKVPDPHYLDMWKRDGRKFYLSQVPKVWVIVGVFPSFNEALKFTYGKD